MVAREALHQLGSSQGGVPTECPVLALCWLYHTGDEATVVRRLLKRNGLERETWDYIICVGVGAPGEKILPLTEA